jgi:hypothetical protein
MRHLKMRYSIFGLGILLMGIGEGAVLGGSAPAVRWGHHLVTPTKDAIFGSMVADSNDGIYLAVSRESIDALGASSKTYYLLKFNRQGDQVRSEQLGAGKAEDPLHVAVDGLAADDRENFYVFGYTGGSLGRENIGKYDAFFAKYDRAGDRQWVRQLGTPEHDVCAGLDIDPSGNFYVAGYTYGDFALANQGKSDLFIAAYDEQGKLLWRDQIGTPEDDRALDLRLGGSNDVYLCGTTSGSLAGPSNGQEDIVVARYTKTGQSLWVRQYGTPMEDRGICMAVGEQGQVYIGGRTAGHFASRRSQRGYGDAFVARVTPAEWIRQFGTRGWDKVFQMTRFTDGSGDVLAGGCQYPFGTFCQAFCHRYSPEGKLIWTTLFGQRRPKAGTCGRAVAVDRENNCYMAGLSSAELFGDNNGSGNLFIVRFDGMPDLRKP